MSFSNGFNRTTILPPPRQVLWVERYKGSSDEKLRVYSPKIEVFFSHWERRHTVPCFADHRLCEGGHNEGTLRWRGYLHGWSSLKNRQIFAQLTAGACYDLMQQIDSGMSLRGAEIFIFRSKADNGRLHARFNDYAMNRAEQLPPALDPEASVVSMWKFDGATEQMRRKEVLRLADLPDDREIGPVC